MRRRISEILALILAFSMIVTAPGVSALAAETYEDPDEVIFEAEDPEEDSSLEEIVLEAQDEETEEFELTEETDEEPGEEPGEQPEDSGTTEKDRLTLMVYLVGSDLERKYFAGTLDMTEILAGIDAALLSDKNTEGNKDIPINVIVETGGVSYNPTMSDARDAAQKAELRATAAKDIKNNESFFTKYDAGLKKLIGEKDLGARTIFDTLTAKSYEGAITGPQDLGEPIDWTKNQRWKLVANPTDFSTAPLTPAKTPVKTENENISLVKSDEDGVITELYDFVDTTMRDYPAEQYALVLWNHGGGPVNGYGVDERDEETDENGNMILKRAGCVTGDNVRKTFGKLKESRGDQWKEFAFVGYDACLMGDIEEVMAWDDYSRFLIASEDLEGQDGWFYLPWMYTVSCAALDKETDVFLATNDMDDFTEQVGKEVVDSFTQWYEGSDGTLALFDLRGTNAESVANAVDNLSDVFLDYLADDPTAAFRSFYIGNKNAIKFAGDGAGNSDIRSLCTKIKELLPLEGQRSEIEINLYDAADQLEQLLYDVENNKGTLINYYQNTGAYETEKTLGGLTVFTPYINTGEAWKYWNMVYGKLEERQAYRDLMGTYAGIQDTGKVLYDIYTNKDDKYATEEDGINELERVLDENLKNFNISERALYLVEDTAHDLYEERITKNDTGAVPKDGVYYSTNDHWTTVDDVYQHGRIDFENENKEIQSMYLGYVSDFKATEDGIILERFGKDLKWFYLSNEGKTYVYPVNVADEYGDDPFTGELYIEVPAVHLELTSHNDDYDDVFTPLEPILLDVKFEAGSETGTIEGYSTFTSLDSMNISRYVSSEEFSDKSYIVPLYDAAETIVGDFNNIRYFLDKDGNFLLQRTKLKDAVLGRGTISQEYIDKMAAELTDWAYDRQKPELKLGTASASIKADHIIRDMFQNEYYIYEEEPAPQDSKKKATIMLYGMGSDLERNSYALSSDMTEISAGLTAAKEKLGVEELPVNVIVDLGGVSYDPNASEKAEGITRENKIDNRTNLRATITAGDYEFVRYNQKMKELGATNPDSYKIFSTLTPTVENGQVVSGDVIDWELNQRYELLPLTQADDNSYYCIASAKNYYENDDPKQKVSMSYSDETGVTPELYDFVKTTMEQYPSEQYILVLWNHGGGEVAGYGKDERGSTLINSYNVKKTFEALQRDVENWQSLSFVGYDACLMSTMQTMQSWYGVADYMVASEALEPGDGWDYVGWVNRLSVAAAEDKDDAFGKSSTMAAITEDIGKTIVDDYVAWYVKDGDDSMGTMALMKLDWNELSKLNRAADDFADALSGYIQAKPDEAYGEIYDIRGETVEFGETADLRHFAFITERNLYGPAYADETTDPVVTAVVDAAQKLMKVFDSKEPVVYHKNTGYFEDWIAKDNTQLGGVSIEFPYRGDSTELWEDYLELYRKIDPNSNSWRNFMGSYTAIRSAGQVLMDIHTGKYTTEETSVAAIEQKLGASLEAFAVNTEMAANIKSKAPKALYDNRITAMDLNVINLGDYYYSRPLSTGNKLLKGVSQHGWLTVGNKSYGLGLLPGGELDDAASENGIKLYNHNENNNWLWVSNAGGTLIYPSSIYDTYLSDAQGNTMGSTLSASLPVALMSGKKDEKGEIIYTQDRLVYLYALFKDGDKNGEIETYSVIDADCPYACSRVEDVKDLKGKYILPLYNAYENLLAGGSEFATVLPGVDPILIDELVVSRGTEAEGLKVIAAANQGMPSDDIYITSGYYFMDKFEQSYELHEKEYRSFGLRWGNLYESGNSMRLPEGTKLTADYLLPVLYVNGEYNEKETEKYKANILANAKISVNGEIVPLTEEGYVLTADSVVYVMLDEADLVPEKMEPGFATMTEEQKAAAQLMWSDEFMAVWDQVKPRVIVVKNEISEDDPRSGLDPVIPLVPEEDNKYSMIMVTGQTYSLGKGQWVSSGTEFVTVGKTNGKVKAKKATPVATDEEGKDVIVSVTNKAANPEVTYNITVVSPALYEVEDNSGESKYTAVKAVILTTIAPDGEAGRARLSLLSADVVNGVPGTITFNTAWVSSNPAVVRVVPDDEDGSTSCTVEAIGNGSAKVTAYVNGKAYNCKFTVSDVFGKKTGYGVPSKLGTKADSDGCLYEEAEICVNPGTSTALSYAKNSGFKPAKATWKYYDGNEKELSEDTAPAYVKSGKLVAVKTGTVRIYGSYAAGGNTVEAEFTVNVVPAPAKRMAYINVGKAATLKFYKVKNAKATWASSDDKIATVDAKGKVTAVSGGYAEITCTYNGVEYKTGVYTETPELDTTDSRLKAGAKANNYTLTLKKGSRFMIGTPGVYHKLNWKSSKAAAFVDENGIIEARSAGKATVSAKINGVTVKIAVIVE